MSTVFTDSQWRIQDFCEGDAAGVWPPIFFGRDDPNFLRQIVSADSRSYDVQRVGAPKGGSRISGWGDDRGTEGPEGGAVGAKRRSAEGCGVWGGAP